MQKKSGIANRRDFLTTSAAVAAAPYFVSSKAYGAGDIVAPSEKITLGVIGMGPRCTYDMTAMLQLNDVQCVAVADVQQSRRDAGKKLIDDHYGNSDLKLYRDFRELLARDDIDAVIVATGDRWHARASMMAAEAGKDVYSEKPCGITIGDCQDLSATFARTKRIFQAGTQRRSVPNFIKAVELAQTGQAWEDSHAVSRPSMFRRSTIPGCLLSKRLPSKSVTGTRGSVRHRGDPTTRNTFKAVGEVNTTSIPGLAYWTGVLTRSTSANGPTTPTIRCRSITSRATRTSLAPTRMVSNSSSTF